MASIPVTAYSAAKVHEHMRQQYSNNEGDPKTGSVLHTLAFGSEKDVPNYNSKMMNSIWGMYNQYASHAFQKNNEGSKAVFNSAFPQAQNGLWDRFSFRY